MAASTLIITKRWYESDIVPCLVLTSRTRHYCDDGVRSLENVIDDNATSSGMPNKSSDMDRRQFPLALPRLVDVNDM